MAESCEAPDLLNIFTKIVCDKQNYCFVCLRTSDERRLVKPEAFRNFLYAAKVRTKGNVSILNKILNECFRMLFVFKKHVLYKE